MPGKVRGGVMDKEHTSRGGRYGVIWSNTSGLVASSIRVTGH